MNIKRLLNIAQEADKIGDYVTADRVDNLLKTAQNKNLMPSMPQMNQQPQRGGVYNPGMAPGATYYTPGVVNVTPQPQMTEEQKAFERFRATGVKQNLERMKAIRDQREKAEAEALERERQSRIFYGKPASPNYLQGTNTEAPFVPNPNAPVNPKLYGTGYASMAMAPQQPMPQQPQTQQTYQNLNNYSYNQNYSTPTNQNYYNNAMMQQQQQQQQQQSFPQANHSGDFYFKSDNGGPIDQSMNVALGTQNNSAKYIDGNPDMTPSR